MAKKKKIKLKIKLKIRKQGKGLKIILDLLLKFALPLVGDSFLW